MTIRANFLRQVIGIHAVVRAYINGGSPFEITSSEIPDAWPL
jgi:hypothetical protein